MNSKIYIFSVSFFLISNIFSQSNGYILKKRAFTYADGLPSIDVTCGVADKYGFLWFGTRNGLCRYDGNKFIVFSKKKYNFRGTKIANLTYDGDLGIIISYEKIFGMFNAENKPCPETDVININSLKVYTLTNYYPNLPFKEADCFSIRNSPNNKIIFRNTGAFQEWNYTKTNGFQKQVTQNDEIPFLELNKKSIGHYFDKIPIINYSKDNYSTTFTNPKINQNEDFKNRFATFKKNRKINFSQNDYSGTAIVNDSTKLFQPEMGVLDIFTNNGKEKFVNIQINSFFKDNQQNYWFCTNEGLVQLTIKKKKFNNFFTKENAWITGNNAVRGIYANNNMLYANLYDYSVLKTPSGITFFKGGSNFAIAAIDGYFWSTNYNLRKFNLQSKEMEFLYHPQNGEIWSIFSLNTSSILLGTANGILLYNKATNTCSSIALGEFPPAVFAYKIFRNRSNQIMVVANNGLYILSDQGAVMDYYSYNAKDKNKKFPFENIYDVYQDTEGIYWIGTNYDGFFRWDKLAKTFRQFDIEDGLVSSTINTIQEDNFGYLWLGTDYGLVQFNKKTFAVKNFTTKDGIANNEFNRTSSFKDENGVLYFGGMNGITSFNPNNFLSTEAVSTSPLSITNYNVFDKISNAFEDNTASILTNRKIVLEERYPFFNISFSLMDYEERNHNYAYMIAGLDNHWTYTTENTLKIGSLPYGKYTLKIKAQAENGSWSNQEITIPIQVILPFYKTWWFLGLTFLTIIGLVIFFFKKRNYDLNKKNEKLELTVKKRTKNLETALAEQLSLTQEIHHRVKNNLQLIRAIIEMQINSTPNASNKGVLKDTSRRINAMTLVHEMLYTTEKIEKISAKTYLNELVEKINEMVNDESLNIEFKLDIENVYFNISDCVSVGMITSELLSNSIKYAFIDIQQPIIQINLLYNTSTKKAVYTVKDNGVGFANVSPGGLGLRLIDIFTRQLNATYTIDTKHGSCFTFEFTVTH